METNTFGRMPGLVDIFQQPQSWSPQIFGDRCFLYDVFVSHASGDESEQFVSRLEAVGLKVWYDNSQYMDDFQWTTRIIWGLRNACSVVCFVGSKDLENHGWVRAEVDATKSVETAAAFRRLYVVQAHWCVSHPSWLGPPSLRYDPREFDFDHEIRSFADKLRDANRLRIETTSPPFDKLMRRAHEVMIGHKAVTSKTFQNGVPLGAFTQRIENAFRVVAKAQSVERVDRSEIGEAMYAVRVASEIYSRTLSTSSSLSTPNAQRLVEDLGLLACLPNLSSDSRGFAYVALENLADGGVELAFKELRACLRWEWDEGIVTLVSDLLERHRDFCDRDDAALMALKSDRVFRAWHLRFLSVDDHVLRMRYYARRVTASSITQVVNQYQREELHLQMARAVQRVNITEVELVLRRASAASGLDGRGAQFFVDRTKAAASSEILPRVVTLLARGWPLPQGASLWSMDFKTVVISPLAVLHRVVEGQTSAMTATLEFVVALEAPLLEDVRLLTTALPHDLDGIATRLAEKELSFRCGLIDTLRAGARTELEGDSVNVMTIPPELEAPTDRWAGERDYLHAIMCDQDSTWLSREAAERKYGALARILSTWFSVPLI